MKPIFVMAVTAALMIPAAASLAEGNPTAGKEKATACAGCHGPDGNSTSPQFPRLAGQYPDYLVQALKEYQTGERSNPIMKGMAASLSPEDMADVAAYFSSQNGVTATPERRLMEKY